jgi:hypothetical protein
VTRRLEPQAIARLLVLVLLVVALGFLAEGIWLLWRLLG